ncbi:MAG: Aconitate hydratase [Rhizobacter sp.]|nr:Aconitate hydratase [Rhizobacter sp.]
MTASNPTFVRTLDAGGKTYRYFSLAAAEASGLGPIARLPYSLKVLAENLLRHGGDTASADVRMLGDWVRREPATREIAYYPSRVLLQDSAGLPLLADMAAMRDAMARSGADPRRINPTVRADLVVDHSIVADVAGRPDALRRNVDLEYARNVERYSFLAWAQKAFSNVRLVPPGNGIVHQVNLEFLAEVVTGAPSADGLTAFPDALLGVDSHTPMANGLGILAWAVGGIEVGAAMLGQPLTLMVPDVVGVRLVGRLPAGVTSTDLALTLTQRLRKHGVVQKFVEFFGPSLCRLPVATRAAVANMAPEYGATVGYFPIDGETIAYLRATGRDEAQVALVEQYARAQGMWCDEGAPAAYSEVVEIDLASIDASVAGPSRPQQRSGLADVPAAFRTALEAQKHGVPARRVAVADRPYDVGDGDVVIAAITSCTNTSDPRVMIGAGLLARNARRRGLSAQPRVKTSFAPGSVVVADYLARAGLQPHLDALGFNVVGFGCTTCMGNSGPLDSQLSQAIESGGLDVAAVLSGNRNFEGRIHPLCRMNYLMSPPLVVAYALAGSLTVDLDHEPLGTAADGTPVYLRDIWPEDDEIERVIADMVSPEMYRARYAQAFEGSEAWKLFAMPDTATFPWKPESTILMPPPFFEDGPLTGATVDDVHGARALAVLGNSVTTDHISPIGTIPSAGAAGDYLRAMHVPEADFGAYLNRRVNHEVMTRGTFGSPRLRNFLVEGEGSMTRYFPGGRVMTIFEAAMRYVAEGTPALVFGGREYGTGSARDWAAKGTRLLGVRAVIAESFERIHRANLIGMGIAPLVYAGGVTTEGLALDGSETFDLIGLREALAKGGTVTLVIHRANGTDETLSLACLLNTAYERAYMAHGGILPAMLKSMAG